MNSLTRVLAALRREQPDRVPTFEWEIDEQVIQTLLPGGSLLDFVEWADLDAVTIFADTRKQHLDSVTYLDEWGVTQRKTVEFYPIPIAHPVRAPRDLVHFKPPDPLAEWHFESLAAAVDRFKGRRAIVFRAQDAFSIPRNLRGMENVMTDFILNPDLLRDMVEIAVAYNATLARQAVELGADVIFLSDDYADNRGPMMSPQHFRTFIAPGLQRVVEATHTAGAPVVKHTDGNIWPILDDLLATGIDGLDPLDPLGGMTIAAAKARCGAHICLKGNVNIGGALSLGTPDEVRAETASCLAAGMPGGGYILSTSNSVMSCVQPANYLAMLDTLSDLGRYEEPS